MTEKEYVVGLPNEIWVMILEYLNVKEDRHRLDEREKEILERLERENETREDHTELFVFILAQLENYKDTLIDIALKDNTEAEVVLDIRRMTNGMMLLDNLISQYIPQERINAMIG